MLFKKNKKTNNKDKLEANNIEFVDLENDNKSEIANTLEQRINYKIIIWQFF